MPFLSRTPSRASGSKALALTALAATLLLGVVAPAEAAIIYRNNFEDDDVGVYTVDNLQADWNSPSWNDGVDEGRVSITDDENAFGQKSLVVRYPQGETTGGKSQWKLDLGGGYEELFLSYRIRFEEGFDFVRGGKLPGLIGGAGNTGGSKPDGTDGWSARMMWRTNGSGGSPTRGDSANIVQYVYHPDQPSTFGQDFRWDDGVDRTWQAFESDRWYRLQHRIVMNTPGLHDGLVQAWLDGELALDVRNIRFRDVASLQIDQMYFSTFFGGSSAAWEASKDEFVYFDDFVVSTAFIDDADFNLDGAVDGVDFLLWQRGETDDPFSQQELADWQANFGKGSVSDVARTTAVPEPSTLLLIVTGLLTMGGGGVRRKRPG